MIERSHGAIIIRCDFCNDHYEGSPDEDFQIVWEQAKDEGWRVAKIANEWIHECPLCRDE